MNQPLKTAQQHWTDYVNQSNGKAILLPEKLRDEAKKVEEMRAEYNTFLQGVAKREIELQMKTQTFWFEFRKELEKSRPDIWIKQVGWNKDAVDAGVFVVNVLENN